MADHVTFGLTIIAGLVSLHFASGQVVEALSAIVTMGGLTCLLGGKVMGTVLDNTTSIFTKGTTL